MSARDRLEYLCSRLFAEIDSLAAELERLPGERAEPCALARDLRSTLVFAVRRLLFLERLDERGEVSARPWSKRR